MRRDGRPGPCPSRRRITVSDSRPGPAPPHNPPGFSNQAGPGRDFLPGRGRPERDFAECRAACQPGPAAPLRYRLRSRPARLGKLRPGRARRCSVRRGPERLRIARAAPVRCRRFAPARFGSPRCGGLGAPPGEWGRRSNSPQEPRNNSRLGGGKNPPERARRKEPPRPGISGRGSAGAAGAPLAARPAASVAGLEPPGGTQLPPPLLGILLGAFSSFASFLRHLRNWFGFVWWFFFPPLPPFFPRRCRWLRECLGYFGSPGGFLGWRLRSARVGGMFCCCFSSIVRFSNFTFAAALWKS